MVVPSGMSQLVAPGSHPSEKMSRRKKEKPLSGKSVIQSSTPPSGDGFSVLC